MRPKKSGLIVASVLLCLVVGAGLEHVRQALFVPPVADGPENSGAIKRHEAPTVRTITVTNSAAERAATEALRRRITELEQALAAREADRAPISAVQDEALREERPRRQSFTERMEQLKKDNPEQYAEMQKRRDEFRQSMERRAQDRANFISAIETQNMNDEQRENHEKLLETVARVNELMAQVGQPGAERNSDLRYEMGETMRNLGELYGAERRYLFEETARAVGYEGEQASVFADHMQTIIDNTSMMSGFGRHGGHGNSAPAVEAAH